MARYIKIIFFIIFICISNSFSFGQNLNEIVTDLKIKYPEEQAVFNKIETDLVIYLENGGPVVKARNYEEIIHLGKYSNNFTTNKIYTNSFETIDEIYAFTEYPFKKRSKKIEVKDFKKSFDKSSSVFYDDTEILNFIFPAIEPGARTVLEYTKTLKEPRFSPGFYFQSYIPIVEAKYSVLVEKGIEIDFDLNNFENYQIKVSKEELKDKVKHTYKVKYIDKYESEDNSPAPQYFIPHINIKIKEYVNNNNQNIDLLSEADDLHDWYRGFVKGLENNKSDEIDSLVQSITQNIHEEKEKVKAIFYWVQENIKYIAFEDGMRGFIPHNGEYVFNKRYGDCKDMASILINMLHHANVKSYFTWVGTRDIPYNYSDFPTPSVDNHMIATYINDGEYYYLDATAQYSPFELPSSMIQGKEVLISFGDKFEIRRVPEINENLNVLTDSITLNLNNGIITGDGHLSLTGFARVFNNYELDVTNEKSKRDYLNSFLLKGSNKFNLESYSISNLKNLESPLLIDYSFSIPNYYQEIGNEIYLNLNLEKPFIDDLLEDDRELPLENEFKFKTKNIYLLTVPVDYEVLNLPDNISHTGPLNFNLTYAQLDNKIKLVAEYHISHLIMYPDQFEYWNQSIKKLSEALSEAIILRKLE